MGCGFAEGLIGFWPGALPSWFRGGVGADGFEGVEGLLGLELFEEAREPEEESGLGAA